MSLITRWLGVSLVALLLPLAASAAADKQVYGKADLDQMLAPIALYPDSVLTHVLIAATYPDDVAEAARWTRRHPDITGQDAVDAVEDRDWDASVKALAAFPEVLARLDDDPDWTARLGEAFIEQEGDVMDRVQFLRQRAYEEGHLDTEHQRIVRERDVIYIEPAVTEVVYVPYYDPWFVYGSWWWSDYPPYCWRTWYGRPVGYYEGGFWWGAGFRVAPTFYFTAARWPEHQIVVAHPGPHTVWRPLFSGRDARHEDVRVWRHEGPSMSSPHQWNGRVERGSPSTRSPEHADTRQEHFPRHDRPEPRNERSQHGPSMWQPERREWHSERHEIPRERRDEDRREERRQGHQEREVQQDSGGWNHEERRELQFTRPAPRAEMRGGEARSQSKGSEAEPQRRGPHERNR